MAKSRDGYLVQPMIGPVDCPGQSEANFLERYEDIKVWLDD